MDQLNEEYIFYSVLNNLFYGGRKSTVVLSYTNDDSTLLDHLPRIFPHQISIEDFPVDNYSDRITCLSVVNFSFRHYDFKLKLNYKYQNTNHHYFCSLIFHSRKFFLVRDDKYINHLRGVFFNYLPILLHIVNILNFYNVHFYNSDFDFVENQICIYMSDDCSSILRSLKTLLWKIIILLRVLSKYNEFSRYD